MKATTKPMTNNECNGSEQHKTLRVIAVFEATKGVLAILLVIGLIELMHHDIRLIVHNIIGHYGLNANNRFPTLLEHGADVFYDTNKLSWFTLAVAYISVRFLEAYGLWHNTIWGESLTAFSGGIYLPFEVSHMLHSPSWSSFLVLIGNTLMVVYLVEQLWQRTISQTSINNVKSNKNDAD